MNLEQVRAALGTEDIALVSIGTQDCSVCQAVKPRLLQLAETYKLPFFVLDAAKEPAAAGFFQAFTAPVVLLFYKGKELERQARFIDFYRLEKLLDQLTESTDLLSYEELFR